MKKPATPVSDHALIQYMELTSDLDLDAVRAEIGRNVEIALEHGAGGVRCNGLVFRLSRGTVTSVHRMSRPPLHIGSFRRQRERPDET